VDEVGHAHGWMSQEQIDSTAVLDGRIADVVAAIVSSQAICRCL